MKHIIIKGIGPDKPGIVSRISGIITSNNGNIEDVSIDFDKFYEAMEYALEIAFDDPEKELEGKNHSEIDEVGQAIMTQYLNPVKKNGNSD